MRLEVICGGMFAGKTEELIRRLRRAVLGRQRVQVFKPAIDQRYHTTRIMTHDGHGLDAMAVEDADVLDGALLPGTQVVGIDEAQFFGRRLVPVVERAVETGRRVIVVGLDLDAFEQPFEPIPHLLALADEVTKLTAVCTVCGAPASRSYRLAPSQERLVVGAKDHYEARCLGCYKAARAA